MLIVGSDRIEVERLLVSGELSCPSCGGVLGPWGHARMRSSRGLDAVVRHRPRRARCSACGGTHVLLVQVWLVRRADGVAVIGAAVEANATGVGHRPIAAALGLPVSTVRGWLRRFTARAEATRAAFTGLLHALDPQAGAVVPGVSGVADALEAIGRAAAAVVVRLAPVGPWEFASRASGGRLLAPLSGAGW